MATLPDPVLQFEKGCPDCGKRQVNLPSPLPPVGDDFDWNTRDYESFRRFMLEELMARAPGRTHWTPADMEMVIVEVFASVLDQLSDMLDRVTAEVYLETARRPESIIQLLRMIGYVAPRSKDEYEQIKTDWIANPQKMEAARREGPRSIRDQKRMVTAGDYARLLQAHPLVTQAHSWLEWGGSWPVIKIAVIPWDDYYHLDDQFAGQPANHTISSDFKNKVTVFHTNYRLADPWIGKPTVRSILNLYIDAYRMAGQEVHLLDYQPVGIYMTISVRIKENYFQSEVKYAVDQALGRDPGGFFEPGRLQFGESVYISDIVQSLMGLEGVAEVCIDPFKRVGKDFPNQNSAGSIALKESEVAVCDNDRSNSARGYYNLRLHGGCRG